MPKARINEICLDHYFKVLTEEEQEALYYDLLQQGDSEFIKEFKKVTKIEKLRNLPISRVFNRSTNLVYNNKEALLQQFFGMTDRI